MSTLAKKQNQVSADRSRSNARAHDFKQQARPSQPLQLGNRAVQRLIRSNSNSSGNSSPHEAATRGTQGSGKTFPFLSQIQRAFGRHDISHARAHEGTNAVSASMAMGASAFTVGHHVAFGSTPDLHTAAHEAAHIVQQRAGVKVPGNVGKVGDLYERHADAVADRVVRGESSEALLDKFASGDNASSPGGSNALQMKKKVDTAFGQFEDVYYDRRTSDAGVDIGGEMYLRFTPGDTVDATKIGLTQAVKSQVDGSPVSPDETGEKQAVKTGKGKDFAIDRFSTHRSPIYGADIRGTGDKDSMAGWNIGSKVEPMTEDVLKSQGLTKGPKFKGMGQYGYRKKSGKGWITQPAELDDTPGIRGADRTKNSGQTFETTAVAIAGAQKNSYYGSVQWGWERDGNGNFKLIDFKAVSQGTPSEIFLAAAKQWNVSKTVENEPTVKLPTVEVYVTSQEVDALAGSETVKLPEATRVQIVRKGKTAKDPVIVRIVDGPSTGKQVSVDATALKKE
jgi:hypothetical protein